MGESWKFKLANFIFSFYQFWAAIPGFRFGFLALWWWSNSIDQSTKLWCKSVSNLYKFHAAQAKTDFQCLSPTHIDICCSILNFNLATFLLVSSFTLDFEGLTVVLWGLQSRVELFDQAKWTFLRGYLPGFSYNLSNHSWHLTRCSFDRFL